MPTTPPFALYFAGDAYSTEQKLMGRQAAGQALLKGVARAWPDATLHSVMRRQKAAGQMVQQLRGDGFTGQLDYSLLPDWRAAAKAGTLYYPAPPAKDIAAARNLVNPHAFSLMGVTHTLSSSSAMDQLADLILPPFEPWDALICTSQAAHTLVTELHEEMRAYWRETTGATRFIDIQCPVIPLGVDVPAFASQAGARAAARAALGLQEEETALLFAGRLAFHAKANPAPLYQALEKLAGELPLVCIEAGSFPGDDIRQAYQHAQQALAPNVRFIWVEGRDKTRYRHAWQGADVFVSLSDNIQETFGLTPVEAMAAGLPVVISDWNGYKDTVRDGVDGFRIPTCIAPPGTGESMALRYALGLDSYDRYIGTASLATVVDPQALVQALRRLLSDPALRRTMGTAGQARAAAHFDWPIILRRYAELAQQLGEIRKHHAAQPTQPWPQRADPLRRFAHYASATLSGDCSVRAQPNAVQRLPVLMSLGMVNFAFNTYGLPREAPSALLKRLQHGAVHSVAALLDQTGLANPEGMQALMWLWKFDLVEVGPAPLANQRNTLDSPL